MEKDMGADGPELQRLTDRLYNDPNPRTAHFNAWWGPEAANMTVEERAAALNRVLDEIDHPVTGLISLLRGEAAMHEDSARCALSKFDTAEMKYVAASGAERMKARREQRIADLMNRAADMIANLHGQLPNGAPPKTHREA